MTPVWILPSGDARTARDAEALGAALGVGPLAARVLIRRGLADLEAARRFMAPSLDQLHDPKLMCGMESAVERLARAIRSREKILIYGDYDVDGTVSVVLLTKVIELAGGLVDYHVPHRLIDGYGMREEVVEAAAASGVRLIVTVDTGIRASKAVRRATELSIDVIVTDHHLPDAELPPAVAVLDPNRPDCRYPNKNLCGAGVAFKLAQALLATLPWPEEKRQRVAESLLKLVAIATVADVVPIVGENRVIVKHGLAGLGEVRNPGLRALLEVAGFARGTAPSARQVAFQIAPRLNAAGRMDSARAAVELFLTADPARATELARGLHDRNADRRQAEDEVRELCERVSVGAAEAALVYYDEKWHRGVIGIVASRLAERFHRPVFVLGRNSEDGLAQGSGRSIPAFHLLDALESMSDLFVRFGGHEHAAGVTLEAARVDEFRARFNARAAACLRPEDLAPRLEIDAVAALAELTEPNAFGVFALAPFGNGNQPPVFAVLGVEVTGVSPLGKDGKHLSIKVRGAGGVLSVKAWRFAERAAEVAPGARVDIAFTLEEDAYSAARGYPAWAATLREVRPAQ